MAEPSSPDKRDPEPRNDERDGATLKSHEPTPTKSWGERVDEPDQFRGEPAFAPQGAEALLATQKQARAIAAEFDSEEKAVEAELQAALGSEGYQFNDEVPGYVEFRFPASATKSKIPHWRALGAFHDAAIAIDDIPLLPTDGSDCNPSRTCFQFYIDYKFAHKFCEATPEVTVEDDDGDSVTLETLARKCLPGQPRVTSAPISYLETEAVYLDVQLEKGYQFNAVTKDLVLDRLREMGLTVYRGTRCQVKVPIDPDDANSDRVSLGAIARTGKINVLVKPADSAVESYPWFRHPYLTVKDKKDITHHIKYKIGGQKAKYLCADYSGCKRPIAECTTKCVEVALERKMAAQTMSAGPSQHHRPSPSDRKRYRDDRAFEGAELLRKHSKLRKDDPNSVPKHQVPCAHLDAGSCRAGRNCGFKHEGSSTDWAKIGCALPRRQNGHCIAGFYCVYNHGPAPG